MQKSQSFPLWIWT